jgi:hypothetical protein
VSFSQGFQAVTATPSFDEIGRDRPCSAELAHKRHTRFLRGASTANDPRSPSTTISTGFDPAPRPREASGEDAAAEDVAEHALDEGFENRIIAAHGDLGEERLGMIAMIAWRRRRSPGAVRIHPDTR